MRPVTHSRSRCISRSTSCDPLMTTRPDLSATTTRSVLYSRMPVCRSMAHSRKPLTSMCGSPAAMSVGSPSHSEAAARYPRSFKTPHPAFLDFSPPRSAGSLLLRFPLPAQLPPLRAWSARFHVPPSASPPRFSRFHSVHRSRPLTGSHGFVLSTVCGSRPGSHGFILCTHAAFFPPAPLALPLARTAPLALPLGELSAKPPERACPKSLPHPLHSTAPLGSPSGSHRTLGSPSARAGGAAA